MVYYSRYYIHEMLLVFFSFIALIAGWRYWQTRKIRWSLLCGVSVGCMATTKETFVITLIAAGLALATNWGWNRWLDASLPPAKFNECRWTHSGRRGCRQPHRDDHLVHLFFFQRERPNRCLALYAPWLNRAGGDSPHIHPWHFYFQRLLWFHPGRVRYGLRPSS